MSTLAPATSDTQSLFRQESVPNLRAASQPILATSNRWQWLFNQLVVASFLFSLAWLAHFTQSRNMGFYSDDHTFAVRSINWSPADFNLWVRTQAVSYPEPQGRPLGFVLGVVLPYFANRWDGVDGMFVVGWWILSLNAILFYHLMRRCFSQPLPLLGAICFLLFPADSTRPFLCHLHILQPSLTFMLVASHLYLGGNRWRKVLAYFLIVPCLITYETALLPFLVIPLLETARDRQWRRRFAIHIITIVLIVAFIGITRSAGGEYRAEQAAGSKFTVLFDIVAGSVIGPAVSFASCVWRVITAVIHLCLNPVDILILLAAAAIFGLVFTLGRKAESSILSRDIKRAAVFGAAAIFVSYILSFTHFPPVCLQGQNTSVHLAAAVGGSALMAAAGAAFLNFKPHPQWKVTATAMIAIYLGLLFVNAQAEQTGYVTLWQERQQFWLQLLQTCPDLTDRTVIVCDGQLPQPSKVMPASSWSDSEVLAQAYQFPANFTQNPLVICFPTDASGDGWRKYVTRNSQGRVIWNKFVTGIKVDAELTEDNTILLHMDDRGNITRIGGSVEVCGKPFRLKNSVPRGLPRYPTLPFYHILLGENR